MFIPGINFSQIVDGRWTLEDAWKFYTYNVKYLGTVTHDQFCKDFPESAQEIEKASKIWDKWDKFAAQLM